MKLEPVITEKSMKDASISRFTFKVTLDANKEQIKTEIEKKFKVNVVKISTVIVKGRGMRTGVRRNEVVRQPFKKAVITVKKGQTIGLFDTGAQQ
jgi:large subunit ribosomal protein L23